MRIIYVHFIDYLCFVFDYVTLDIVFSFTEYPCVQIAGTLSTVRKALLSVSSCLQDNSRIDLVNLSTPKFSGMSQDGTGYHTPEQFSRSSGVESAGINHRMVLEEEVVFKVLCPADKVGNLIGKGGSIVRVIQTETGASIKVADSASHLDDRVVVISAREVHRRTID